MANLSSLKTIAVALAVALAPAPALAQAREEEPTRAVEGFSGFAELENNVGSATFVDAGYFGVAVGALRLSPGYGFDLAGLKLSANADWGVSYEYWPDIGAARRPVWSDLQLWLSAPDVLREPHTGITLTPGLGVTLPLHFDFGSGSRLTTLAAGLRAEWQYRGLGLGLRIAAGHPLYAAQHLLLTPGYDVIAVCRADETYCLPYPPGPTWTLAGSLLAEFHPTAGFSFGVQATLSEAWTEIASVGGDPYTSQALDSNGKPVVALRTAQRSTFGTQLFASYAFLPYLGISSGISRVAPPISRDGRTLVLWALDTYSALFVSVWGRSSPSLSKYWLLW